MLIALISSVLVQLPAAPVTFQHGVLTPPLVGTPGEAALRYAQSRRDELGLDARSTLAVGPMFSTRFGGSVHLIQRVDGLEVRGGRVIVTLDEQQRVVRMSSSLKRFVTAQTTPRLSAQRALAIATHEVDGALLSSSGVPYGGAQPFAFLVGDALHAGFLTWVPTLKSSESWHVAIDAVTGDVLQVEDRAHAANAAKVYASSPGGLQAGIGVTPLIDVDLGAGLPDGGFLTGERIRALNCCPTEGCLPDAGPRRVQGQTQTFGGVVSYDVAICDQRQRATNDPAVHASGDFVYAPVDPPNTVAPSLAQPADYDEFAEVHAYYHVSKAYDAVRALSQGPVARDGGFSPFVMRNTGGDLPAVWVNVSDPDFQNAMQNAQGVYVSNTLSRTDNAMFVARENMEYLLLPPLRLASDALVIYQGAKVDFAYDGPVLWHEFGHGVIHSTSNWDTVVSFDARSANNESSALHEGIADLLSVMTSGNDPVVGAYVGPRLDPNMSAIRNVANNFRCPDVLWGESHEDSMHFTGAVWEARQQHFQGLDQGRTFDAALYAAIVSFPPDVNFAKAAEIITASVAQAFPSMNDARTKMQAAFDGRGATNCSKVLDVTDSLTRPRYYFNIAGTQFAQVADGSAVPGPYQFKIHVPAGAKSVTVRAPYQVGGGSTTARLEVLAAADRPITFVKNGTALANDAQKKVVPTVANSVMTGKVAIDVPCGGDLYFAVANTSRRDRPLQNLSYSFEPADSCGTPDAGMEADAGMTEPPQPLRLTGVGDALGPQLPGCGCTAVEPLALLPTLLWFVRRRRR